jgi:hypothetical protein
MVQEVRAGV